jgi:hypothetical protein
MFRITDGRGFHMTFANGWTVSVQFGPYSHCSNRDLNSRIGESYARASRDAGKQGSIDAEIAAWDSNDVWYDFGDDKIKGWVKPDEVADFIEMIRKKDA